MQLVNFGLAYQEITLWCKRHQRVFINVQVFKEFLEFD